MKTKSLLHTGLLLISVLLGAMHATGQSSQGYFIFPVYYADPAQLVNNHIRQIQFVEKNESMNTLTRITLDEQGRMTSRYVNSCRNVMTSLMKGELVPDCSFRNEYNHTLPCLYACPSKSNLSACDCDSLGRIRTAAENDMQAEYRYDAMGRYIMEATILYGKRKETCYTYEGNRLMKVETYLVKDTARTLKESFIYIYDTEYPDRLAEVTRMATIGSDTQLYRIGRYRYQYNAKGMITAIRYNDTYADVDDRTIRITYITAE